MSRFIYSKKRLTGVLLILMLLTVSIFAGTSSESISYAENTDLEKTSSQGTEDIPGSKDEVVYANLDAEGTLENVYIVNVLNIGESGLATDHGEYTKVSNLTDTTEIINTGGKITVDSQPGKFYYEGYPQDCELPWYIDVAYFLDEEKVSPDELAGASGSLEILIKVSENKDADPVFFENYMLQISLPMDMDLCENVVYDGGAEGLSGNTKLINFTVLPGNTGDFSVNADISDFEMGSIEIAGIPFSMDFDLNEMTSEFDELIDAVSGLNSGMRSLDEGIGEMSDGLGESSKGSRTINNGLKKLNSGTGKLSDASSDIKDGLTSMSALFNASSGSGDISDLIDSITLISNQLKETSTGMGMIIDALDAVAPASGDLPQQDIYKILSSGELEGTNIKDEVENVIDYATRSAMFIETYHTVSTSLGAISQGIGVLSGHMDTMAKKMEPLKDLSDLGAGLSLLSKNYSSFDKGVQKYFKGVDALSKNYKKFNKGMKDISIGGAELSSGAGELADGMKEFDSAVQDIPNQIDGKIESILGSDDFVPKSFVSPKNKDVNFVQFVITTDKIKKPKEVKEEEDSDQGKKSILQRIIDLF